MSQKEMDGSVRGGISYFLKTKHPLFPIYQMSIHRQVKDPYLSVPHPFICLSVHLPIYPPVQLPIQSLVCPSICPSIHLCTASIHPSIVHLSRKVRSQLVSPGLLGRACGPVAFMGHVTCLPGLGRQPRPSPQAGGRSGHVGVFIPRWRLPGCCWAE